MNDFAGRQSSGQKGGKSMSFGPSGFDAGWMQKTNKKKWEKTTRDNKCLLKTKKNTKKLCRVCVSIVCKIFQVSTARQRHLARGSANERDPLFSGDPTHRHTSQHNFTRNSIDRPSRSLTRSRSRMAHQNKTNTSRCNVTSLFTSTRKPCERTRRQQKAVKRVESFDGLVQLARKFPRLRRALVCSSRFKVDFRESKAPQERAWANVSGGWVSCENFSGPKKPRKREKF